jgi:hypothetical protein
MGRSTLENYFVMYPNVEYVYTTYDTKVHSNYIELGHV